MSIPGMQLFLRSALTISFGLASTVEVTPLIGGFLMHFFKKFRVYIVFSFALIFAYGWFSACGGFYGACAYWLSHTINHLHLGFRFTD